MRCNAIVWSFVIGVLFCSFSTIAHAEEATPEEQTMMLEEFYNNNPIIMENQKEHLKDVLGFLYDNGVKYYKYHDLEQQYVHVSPQVFYESPYNKRGSGYKTCVVRMNLRLDAPEDLIAVYVFGNLRGEAYIDLPDSGYDFTARMVDITGHTFYGMLTSSADPYRGNCRSIK